MYEVLAKIYTVLKELRVDDLIIGKKKIIDILFLVPCIRTLMGNFS